MEQTITFTPWRSIKAGVVTLEDRPLSFTESRESPCATCSTSPCCTHLPVHNFRVATFADLSHAGYLLNFDRIRLGVTQGGDWSVYYVQPCQFLDRGDFTCTVHNTPEQPQICQNYNPYSCWYRKALTSSTTEDFVLLDRSRLSWLTDHTVFDEMRNVVAMPHWDDMRAAIDELGDEPGTPAEPPLADPAYDAWAALVASGEPLDAAGEAPEKLTYTDNQDPCTGCSAPCCSTLEFAQGMPILRSTIDYYRFCLGFPGVELSITDTGWNLVIKTTCRHLDNGQCSVYGQPERPLECRYYDAWKCTYRIEFGQPRPAGAVRVRLEHFDALTECLAFDNDGAVLSLPTVTELRSHVEERWRERV